MKARVEYCGEEEHEKDYKQVPDGECQQNPLEMASSGAGPIWSDLYFLDRICYESADQNYIPGFLSSSDE